VSDQMTQVVCKYPELASDSEGRSLQTELDMFRTLPAVKKKSSIPVHSQALRSMVPTMCAMFPHVEALVRLSTQHLLQLYLQQFAPIEILT